jgi:hypothetical protein
MFDPVAVTLREAGPEDESRWIVVSPLVWSGDDGVPSPWRLEVPAEFKTDLASVPRSLTWLFPRYGKYTKAAVVHDYLGQGFSKADTRASFTSPFPLRDRSDADEVFRLLMAELKVPKLRWLLMWAAVSWATLFSSLFPGRRSKPVERWAGRVLAVAGLVLASVLLIRHTSCSSVIGGIALAPASVAVGGTVALGRVDRAPAFAVAYLVTLLFSPLLALGAVIGVVLYGYLFLEDLLSGFPATRMLIANLFSAEAKARKLGSPQFARIAAVIES